jgi:uncharacterized membrane protein YedE/YeeE
MVEIVSWIMVALVAVFAVVGFLGVVGASLVLGARRLTDMRSTEHSHLKTAVRPG